MRADLLLIIFFVLFVGALAFDLLVFIADG